MTVTAFDLAQRFVNMKEVAGPTSNPLVLGMLQLDDKWPKDDAVPWCSAFLNFITWLLRLPRSKSLAARSWLTVGQAIAIDSAMPGFDVVVLKRGGGAQPGPTVIKAPGHVGFFAGYDRTAKTVQVLGGNQGDSVSVASFPVAQVLGVRRLV
jgi:uncharacterized protein (TIGR02594 family)